MRLKLGTLRTAQSIMKYKGANMDKKLKLLDNLSYSSKLVLSQVQGYLATKLSKGWSQRKDGLFEDVIGNVFTLDLNVTHNQVLIRMKAVPVVRSIAA